MRFLKVKDIVMGVDHREENILERDKEGKPIKFRQSEYTCGLVLENEEECQFVIKNKHIEKILNCVAENEDKKYPSAPLKRNMFLLNSIMPIYIKYLKEHGFQPPEQDIILAMKHKRGKYENKN